MYLSICILETFRSVKIDKEQIEIERDPSSFGVVWGFYY